MPELPEVNTLARALDHQLKGDSIISWQPLAPKLRKPLPDTQSAEVILEQPIRRVFRQAKSIFFEFATGHYLHVHLGMTGYFRLMNDNSDPDKHRHLVIELLSGRTLSYFDPRKFGVVEILHRLPDKVPEPFKDDLSIEYIRLACQKSRRAIKTMIMDQSIIAGLGNIYAGEALFKAGIMPDRPASELSKAEVTRLYNAMLEVIDSAVTAGLKSLLPNFYIDEETTHFEIDTSVYQKAGLLCCQCRKQSIEKIDIGGRSSFYCRNCQK
jgi:formamidopyrimidine-DNA glycosylase